MTTANDVPAFDPDGEDRVDVRLFSWKGVVFDQKDGLGAVPNVQDVDYFGFVGFVRPSMFLSLCAEGLRERNPMPSLIEAGRRISMGFLTVDVVDGVPRIAGHEGRHRMDALRTIAGDEPMPVAILVRGTRARSITEQTLELLDAGMMSEPTRYGETTSMVDGPIFDLVVHQGRRVRLRAEPEATAAFGL